jgi:iron complex outermembrane receptor protein
VRCLYRKLLVLSLSLFLVFTLAAHAADQNEVKSLDEIVIEAPKAELRDTFDDFMPIPTSKFKVDRQEIDTINTISIEDTVRYAPNIEVRRRYFGDPNGVISMRGNGNFQTARQMVFVDGFALHSLLRTRFNGAPQWNFVAADETDHVNITYGPFSPKHSGNAMGGVIDIQSRQPNQEEWTLQTTGWVQDWELHQSKGNAPGYKTFFAHGNKIGKLSYYMFYNRLETQTQPTGATSRATPDGQTATTAVTGAINLRDATAADVVIFGDDGEENSIQDLFKMKMNYDFSSQFKLRGMIAFLDRHRDQLNVNNYVRDANGNKVWSSTNLSLNGKAFRIRANDFDVSKQDKRDLLIGVGAKGTLANNWKYDVTLSTYFILQDEARDSDENPRDPVFDGSGRLTEFSDTGWQMVEMRFNKEAILNSKNTSFEGGYHYDHAKLETVRHNIPNWEFSERDEGTFDESSGGETDTHAFYGNLGFQLTKKWDLQAGLRSEVWRSFNGFKHEAASDLGGHLHRMEYAFSPKLSLGFKPNDEWDLRFSLARATRFPLPQELFENVDDLQNSSISSPGLKPEVGNHATIMIGNYKPKKTIQLNLFFDEVTDTIFSDQDITGSTTTSTFVNIDKVRTFGAEFVTQRRDFLISKHDLSFNISYTNSEIRRHDSNPSVAGNRLPRIPEWRAKFQSLYHLTNKWNAMVAGRYQDKAFGQIDNSDILRGDNGQDEYFFLDLKTTYQFKTVNASFGVNNLTDQQAYTGPHTFPNRSYSVDLKWNFM